MMLVSVLAMVSAGRYQAAIPLGSSSLANSSTTSLTAPTVCLLDSQISAAPGNVKIRTNIFGIEIPDCSSCKCQGVADMSKAGSCGSCDCHEQACNRPTDRSAVVLPRHYGTGLLADLKAVEPLEFLITL